MGSFGFPCHRAAGNGRPSLPNTGLSIPWHDGNRDLGAGSSGFHAAERQRTARVRCYLEVSISRRGGNRLPSLPLELGVSMPRCDGSRPSAGKAGFARPAVTTAAQVRTKSRVSMSHRAGNLCHVRGGVSGIRVGSARESRETEPVVRALEFGYMRLGRAFGYMRSLGTHSGRAVLGMAHAP